MSCRMGPQRNSCTWPAPKLAHFFPLKHLQFIAVTATTTAAAAAVTTAAAAAVTTAAAAAVTTAACI